MTKQTFPSIDVYHLANMYNDQVDHSEWNKRQYKVCDRQTSQLRF